MSRKPDPQRQARIAALIQELSHQLQEEDPDQSATFDQIEERTAEIGRQISQDLQRQVMQQRNRQNRLPKSQCACGGLARYKGQQTRSLVTTQGVLTYKRACYHCPACQKSFAPLDQQLALDAGSTSTQVRLWVALLAGQLPFAQAATTLAMLTKVDLSAASVERLSVQMGASLREEQHRKGHQHYANTLPEPHDKRPKRLYIGMDGVYVPLREAWKKDKSAGELSCRYGECKSGVVYETHQDKEGRDSQVRTAAYVATLEAVDVFAPLLATLAHEAGQHRAKEVIVLGDGAPWIWQLSARQFPAAIEIVDFFHASQHLAALADARFGKESEESKQWLQARQAELKSEGVRPVLAAIQAWRPSSAAKQHLRKTTYAYFHTHASRMRYPEYIQKGYHIGSGVVEATCKHVVAQRLDQAGMHWRQESAEAILALRGAQRSSCGPDLRPHCAMAN